MRAVERYTCGYMVQYVLIQRESGKSIRRPAMRKDVEDRSKTASSVESMLVSSMGEYVA